MKITLVNYGKTGLGELGMNILYGNNKIGEISYFPTAEKELRYFGKELKFRPDGIDIIAKDNQVFATLNDDGVLYLNAEKSISMSAVENITMKAPKVNIEALNGITWKTPGSKVEMTTDIVIEGAKVKTN